MKIDPVCGMNVEESTPHQVTRDGETTYFCSAHCQQTFESGMDHSGHDHHRHGNHAAPVATTTVTPNGPLVYTCPMHPEVEQDHPGDCPKCGMALEPKTISADTPDDASEYRDMKRRFLVGAALTLPVFLLAMAHLVPGLHHHPVISGDLSRWIQFLLATPVVGWAGWPFFVRGWKSLKNRSLNMFTLIALGVGSAYVFTAVAMLFPQVFPPSFTRHGKVDIYAESAAVIVVLVLLGQVLELRARRNTGQAIRALLGLSPRNALVIRHGAEISVPLEQVVVDDLIRIKPGEKVPVDGVVSEGSSHVNESMITGESMPIGKNPGDPVIGGTVNGNGSLIMKAMRIGRDTVLAQIVEMVSHAQRSRAPVQALADKVSRIFVPAVIVTAVLTFMMWALFGPEPRFAYAIANAVAVLIIACPCALGLATPMSIMVGVGRGAQAGVLIREASTIEAMEKVDTLVVDKTGTLTEGRPQVVRITPVPGIAEAELLTITASLEVGSEHPLADAIVRSARERNLALRPVTRFSSVPGNGVSGYLENRRVIAGKGRFLQEQGVRGLEALAAAEEQLADAGCSIIHIAADDRAIGLVAVADPVKPSTKPALARLHALGIRVIMLTGDHPKTAHAIAGRLNIREVFAGVEPKDKFDHVRRLRNEGYIVAMAGDGINDAPALAAAHVGIAMGTGTDVAMESAGITLVKGDLNGIARGISLSRRMMRNIRQNLLFAFGYNIIGIPVAAGLLYPAFGLLLSPMIAGAAMSFSSVSVIVNALRLARLKL